MYADTKWKTIYNQATEITLTQNIKQSVTKLLKSH